MEKEITVGFALTGSFCTFKKVFPCIQKLVDEKINVIPIMSEICTVTDTRFGKASEHVEILKNITKSEVISTIKEAEPIGPKGLLDFLVIAPCTGNTLAKIANGIADTTVTLAAKAHLRNKRPLIIGVSTNDGLGTNAKNIGVLLNRKNVYFIPFGQDDCVGKENSLVANFELVLETLASASEGNQLQPVLI
ncbi:MAG: dipicolinate synthase subunit B [Oscillospiraceae bacterium]